MTDANKITPDQIIELAGKATPLPYVLDGKNRMRAGQQTVADLRYKNGYRDGQYIVAACNSAPALARAAKAMERVREILGPKLKEAEVRFDATFDPPPACYIEISDSDLRSLLNAIGGT